MVVWRGEISEVLRLSNVQLYIYDIQSVNLYCRKHRQNVRISCERDQRDLYQSYGEEGEEEEVEGELTDWELQSYCRPTFKLQTERSAASPSLRKQSLVNNTVLRHTKELRSYNQSKSTLNNMETCKPSQL